MSGLFAARAYFALDYLGHGTDAALLDGGLEKWKAEHRAVSTAAPAFKAVHLTVKARPQLVASLAAMKQMVADNKTTLIDARPPDEYSGAKPVTACREPDTSLEQRMFSGWTIWRAEGIPF